MFRLSAEHVHLNLTKYIRRPRGRMARGEGRDGRGLSLARRIKAICWWCHQHNEVPETDAWLVANAVTDERIEELYRKAWEKSPQGAWEASGVPMLYGTGIAWDDFHRPSEYHGTPE